MSDATSGNRILWNVRGEDIDEVVFRKPRLVHVEQMTERCWWIGVYFGDIHGPSWMGNFVADSRGRMRFVEQENDGVVWDENGSHDE
jgi:hypothetical protein